MPEKDAAMACSAPEHEITSGMKELKVRRAVKEDIFVLSLVIRWSFRDVAERFSLTPENCPRHPSNCTDEWVKKDMARGVRYYILEDNKETAGCVALDFREREVCYLERLAVLPEYRRQGCGRMLVRHALAEAASLGAGRVGIGIIARHEELRRWYRNLGFEEGEEAEFPQLPFTVAFLSYRLP